jgi:hypothetical protein
MSKIDFKDLVSHFLVEQEPAQPQTATQPVQPQTATQTNQNIVKFLQDNQSSGFKQLIDAYNNRYSANIDLTNLENFLQTVSQYGYFAGKTLESAGGYTFIPFFDAFLQILDGIRKNNSKAEYTHLKEAILKNPAIGFNEFKGVAERIKAQTDPSLEQYMPVNSSLLKAKGVLDNQVDRLSQVAIDQLSQDPILTAVEKIVAKRTSVVQRLNHLKGVKKPFSKTLIQPLFYSYNSFVSSTPGNLLSGLYSGWQKKVSGDFQSAVDDLTSNKIMEIAILAGDYYKHLLNLTMTDSGQKDSNIFSKEYKTKVQGPTPTLPPHQLAGMSGAPKPPAPSGIVTSSLNLFDQIAGTILLVKEASIDSYQAALKRADTQQVQQQAKDQNTTRTQPNPPAPDQKNIDINEIQDFIKMTGSQKFVDYQNFLEKGAGKYFEDNIFNIGKINEHAKSGDKQAAALYNALKGIAFYTRKGIGAKNVVGAVGALGVGMGPVN